MPANRIAKLRRAAGYSQRGLMRRIAELSKGTITSPSYLATIGRGRQSASPHFEGIAARALDCNVFAFQGQPRLVTTTEHIAKADSWWPLSHRLRCAATARQRDSLSESWGG